MPLLSRDQIKGWKAVFSKDGGWLAAAKAINAIGEYLRNQGVKFGFYGAGSFKQPLLAEGTCIGVETVDGTKYYADKVILAAGAWSSALVDLEEQCVSKVGLDMRTLRLDTDLSGLGICPHSAHPTGSRPLQERTCGLQWGRWILLRAQRARRDQGL
jgi:glycine/D-amino acid oxidase-like deaminating enzyme